MRNKGCKVGRIFLVGILIIISLIYPPGRGGCLQVQADVPEVVNLGNDDIVTIQEKLQQTVYTKRYDGNTLCSKQTVSISGGRTAVIELQYASKDVRADGQTVTVENALVQQEGAPEQAVSPETLGNLKSRTYHGTIVPETLYLDECSGIAVYGKNADGKDILLDASNVQLILVEHPTAVSEGIIPTLGAVSWNQTEDASGLQNGLVSICLVDSGRVETGNYQFGETYQIQAVCQKTASEGVSADTPVRIPDTDVGTEGGSRIPNPEERQDSATGTENSGNTGMGAAGEPGTTGAGVNMSQSGTGNTTNTGQNTTNTGQNTASTGQNTANTGNAVPAGSNPANNHVANNADWEFIWNKIMNSQNGWQGTSSNERDAANTAQTDKTDHSYKSGEAGETPVIPDSAVKVQDLLPVTKGALQKDPGRQKRKITVFRTLRGNVWLRVVYKKNNGKKTVLLYKQNLLKKKAAQKKMSGNKQTKQLILVKARTDAKTITLPGRIRTKKQNWKVSGVKSKAFRQLRKGTVLNVKAKTRAGYRKRLRQLQKAKVPKGIRIRRQG